MNSNFDDIAQIDDALEVPKATETILAVNGLSKKYCRNLKRAMFYSLLDVGSELFGIRKAKKGLRKSEFWALKDVSFELKKGEAIGLVGSNGAGKTTLLKIISGLIKPDQGDVIVKGRIAPLIALGAGFNPILSGRENVFINMAILGLTQLQIAERFDEVINFAEIGDAIDAPVQTYSSGMSARLGFACAIHIDADLLLIDEVLAVGDIKFRVKCYRKLAELQRKGTSFVLVSHSTQSLLAVCKLGLFLSGGKLIKNSTIEYVLAAYEDSLMDSTMLNSPINMKLPANNNDVSISSIKIKNESGEEVASLQIREEYRMDFLIHSIKRVSKIKMIIIIRLNAIESDYAVYIDSSKDDFFFDVIPGENQISILFPFCALKAGLYSMKVSITGENHFVYDSIEGYTFSVKNAGNEVNSIFYQKRKWLNS